VEPRRRCQQAGYRVVFHPVRRTNRADGRVAPTSDQAELKSAVRHPSRPAWRWAPDGSLFIGADAGPEPSWRVLRKLMIAFQSERRRLDRLQGARALRRGPVAERQAHGRSRCRAESRWSDGRPRRRAALLHRVSGEEPPRPRPAPRRPGRAAIVSKHGLEAGTAGAPASCARRPPCARRSRGGRSRSR
jgi:hypothetical protein